jgi:sarcosine oxidase, subunit gamma
MNPHSQTTRRQSSVHDLLASRSPIWTAFGDMAAVLRFQDRASEVRLREELALCDMSCFARMSVKGPLAVQRMTECGIPVPQKLYEHRQSEDDGLVVRVDSQEVFLEDRPDSRLVDLVRSRLDPTMPGVYSLDRQEAAFWLAGNRATQVLAQTCGIDFREPTPQWVFSRVAGVSCGLLPWKVDRTPVFRIWTDASYGAYLWEELLKIVRELDGDAVGLGCFYPELNANASPDGR